MRSILTAFLVLCSYASVGDWATTERGVSPDGKFAVAVFPQKTEFIDQADHTVLLVDQIKDRRIGPLEEVFSSGGGWGTTTTNVHCAWSADSTLLIVSFRTGRLMHSAQIYRIRNRRAIPLTFPALKTHPKGAVLQGLETTANPGCEVTLAKDGTILERVWGYIPNSNVDYAKHGLKGFEDKLLFHYRLGRKDSLILHDITVPPVQ